MEKAFVIGCIVLFIALMVFGVNLLAHFDAKEAAEREQLRKWRERRGEETIEDEEEWW